MRGGGEWVQERGELPARKSRHGPIQEGGPAGPAVRSENSGSCRSRVSQADLFFCPLPTYTDYVLHLNCGKSQAKPDLSRRGGSTSGGEESCTGSTDQRESTGAGVPGGAGGGTQPETPGAGEAERGFRDRSYRGW